MLALHLMTMKPNNFDRNHNLFAVFVFSETVSEYFYGFYLFPDDIAL